jgi:hypothetical protein
MPARQQGPADQLVLSSSHRNHIAQLVVEHFQLVEKDFLVPAVYQLEALLLLIQAAHLIPRLCCLLRVLAHFCAHLWMRDLHLHLRAIMDGRARVSGPRVRERKREARDQERSNGRASVPERHGDWRPGTP